MAITREKKEAMLAQYAELLSRSQAVIITRYGGLNMPQLDKVRRQIRESQGEFHVVKNTLAWRALQSAGYSVPEEWLVGQTAFSFCFKDPAATAKAVSELSKELEPFQIVGGLLNGRPIDKAQVEALAALPPLDTLRAQVIGLLAAPATGVVSAINAVLSGVLYALQAKVDKEQPAEAPAAA